jgi:hypothetical protein
MKNLKNTRTALLIFLLLPLLAVECYDEPFAPKLPPETQEGKGMMAAEVNGVIWLAEGWGGLLGGENPWADYLSEKGRLRFGGTDYRGDETSRFFGRIDNVYEEGVYFVWGMDPIHDGTAIHFSSASHRRCSPHRFNPATVEITRFDTIRNIVSGRFFFDGICESGDTVEVRKGRFDIEFELRE